MIKLKNKPIFNKTGIYSKILIDADLVAYSCASASDGSYYSVNDGFFHEEACRFRYKKELDEYLKDHPLDSDQWVRHDYEPETLDTCLHSVKMLTSSIIETLGGGDYQLYLTGKDNFRLKVNPLYKANRKDVRRPYHLDSCRKYLVEHFGAIIVDGMEADDMLGVNQTSTSIIASNDKDLDMVPGWHYNWNKQEVYSITEEEGRLNFWAQVLSGDRTDNIEGIHGVAKKTAEKLLKASKLTSDKDYYSRVLQVYQQYKSPLREGFRSQVEWAKNRVEKVAKQIWILREEGNMWEEPTDVL